MAKMQSWRTAQKLTNPRSTGRSKRTTNCGKFSRTCQRKTKCSSTVTVSHRKCNRWMMSKQHHHWPPKGSSYLCKVGSTNRRTIWSESRKRSRRSSRNVWTSFRKWIEADQELESANSKQTQAKYEMAILVAEQTTENAKAVNRGFPFVQTQSAGTTSEQHNKPSQCSNPFSRCKAGATDEDLKEISQNMAQTVWQLEAGSVPLEPGLEANSLPCEVVGSDEEFSTGECVPGFSNMDIEGQKTIKRSLSNAFTEKRRPPKKCKQEGQGM